MTVHGPRSTLHDFEIDLAVDRGVMERLVLGDHDVHFIADHGKAIVAEIVAGEEIVAELRVLAAHGPFHFVDVADFEIGKRDDQLLVGIVDLKVRGHVAQLHVPRLDLDNASRLLVNAGFVENELFKIRIESHGLVFAQGIDALAAAQARDLVRDRFDGAVLLDEMTRPRIKNAGRGVVDELVRHRL